VVVIELGVANWIGVDPSPLESVRIPSRGPAEDEEAGAKVSILEREVAMVPRLISFARRTTRAVSKFLSQICNIGGI
jgi:hypothetical protein